MYASLLIRRDQPRQAAHILQQLSPKFPTLGRLGWLGRVQGILVKPCEAGKAYRRVLAVEPQNRQASFNLA